MEVPELCMDELMFFEGHGGALALYERFRERVFEQLGPLEIRVKKTQISFIRRRLIAAVSFLPVRRARERPNPFLTITFGWFRELESPRVDAAGEVCPNRWTHHVMIGSAEEIDDELMDWIKEAARLSELKH